MTKYFTDFHNIQLNIMPKGCMRKEEDMEAHPKDPYETVFMILGQCIDTGSAMAPENDIIIHDVDHEELNEVL